MLSRFVGLIMSSVLIMSVTAASADESRLSLSVGDKFEYTGYWRTEDPVTLVKAVVEITNDAIIYNVTDIASGKKAKEIHNKDGAVVERPHPKFWWGEDKRETYGKYTADWKEVRGGHDGTAMHDMTKGWDHQFYVFERKKWRNITCQGATPHVLQFGDTNRSVLATSCFLKWQGNENGQTISVMIDAELSVPVIRDSSWKDGGRAGFKLTGMKLMPREKKVTQK